MRFLYRIALLLICLGYLIPGFVVGQSGGNYDYFNQWYHFNQNYIKLQLDEDGLYRVSKNDLTAAGVDVSNLIPENLQVIFRGKEIKIRVNKSGTELDYFEFLGQSNDGHLDSLMYRSSLAPFRFDPQQQPNQFRSYFTDTTSYFITWDSVGTQRYEPIQPVNYAAYTPEPWYRYRSLKQFNDIWFKGGGSNTNVFHVLNPDYVTGEGFAGPPFVTGGNVDAAASYLPTPGYAGSGSPNHLVSRVLSTTTAATHILEIQERLNSTSIHRDTTAGINIGTREALFTDVLNPTTLIRYLAHGNGTKPDKGRPCWHYLEYDRLFDLDGESETVVRNWVRTDSTYLRFYNADVVNSAWLLDGNNSQIIEATVSGDSLHFLVPGFAGSRTLRIFTDQAVKTPQILNKTSLVNLSNPNTEAEFVIITHRKFENSAQKYAQYRDSSSVNSMSSKVVYIDEIYDEFGYGSMTSWSIKNFCRYAMDHWAVPPRFFMIWGKGRPNQRIDHQYNFIPSFGEPANDYEFVSNFDRLTPDLSPEAGIGRVSIIEDEDGINYLAKIDLYEHRDYQAWGKEAVFIGGGKTAVEQERIGTAWTDLFQPYVEGAPMGGKTHIFQTYNTGNISNSELTSEEHINQGVGLIHFFGHSGSNIFDVDILEAKLYQNYGRPPFMVAFGCYGGDFNNASQSFGERFLLEPNRGCIGYLANTTAGFLEQLRFFGEDFYQNLFGTSYGRPIGEVLQKTVTQFAVSGNFENNILTANHAKQMNLQGDPTLILRFPVKPDLRIAEQDLYFDPETISALDNDYTMNLIVHNDGTTFSDSFQLKVGHRLPGGEVLNYPPQNYGPINYVDTIQYNIVNTVGPDLAGLNNYEVWVDALDSLAEYIEPNNRLNYEVIIQSNIPAVLFPYEYAIVDDAQTTLSASTWIIGRDTDLAYFFEIDTVHDFSSQFRQGSGVVNGSSAYGSWDPPFALQINQVYYWRVRLANVYPVQWNESSFKYIPGKTGWAQSDEPQFFKDPASHVSIDPVNNAWIFDHFDLGLHCYIRSFGDFSGNPEFFMGEYGSNNFPTNGFCYTAISSKTLNPNFIATNYGDWNFINAHNPSGGSPGTILPLLDDIQTTPEGDYFLICSSHNPLFGNWESQWFEILEYIGVSSEQVSGLVNGDQIIILGKKGSAPGSAIVITEPNLPIGNEEPRLDLLTELSASYDSATISSTTIGPTDDWTTFTNDWHSLDLHSPEEMPCQVYGLRNDLSETLLLDNLGFGTTQLSTIDASEYPFLRLVSLPQDKIFQTPPQLDSWEVYFNPAPDASVDPALVFSIKDTISEGELMDFEIGVRNVSNYDLDSLLVRYSLQRQDRSVEIIGEKRYAPVPAQETQVLGFQFHSAGKDLGGDVTLVIELNPELDQVEQYKFNNFYFHRMYVKTDEVGPILDVTIDGKRIMDGDLVSPTPEILIELNDENEFLPVSISDTTYKVWFGTERSFQLNSQVFIENNPQIEEVTGRLPSNKAQLMFRPGTLADGEYTLAVQGFDFKGNQSGSEEYVIHFNVVNEKAISKVLPYPNPFSSSAQFVYTLTGNELPYQFEIHIYTIAGRLVKVIDLLALDDVKIGYNITDYRWDGRDEFGDALANGVYIYKTKVKFKDRYGVGERDENIDQYFNKSGFGKIYLMR